MLSIAHTIRCYLAGIAFCIAWTPVLRAEDPPPINTPPKPATAPVDDVPKVQNVLPAQQNAAAEQLQAASGKSVRRFHEVLDELLAEFGYDVKLGQLKGLKNVAIRKVEVSDALPSSYRKYVELLITERIRENSTVKLINCLPCATKTSKVVEGKLIITSPATNIAELKTVADRMGIDNFMDIILVYHPTHMVLAFEIFKVDTNETIWARSYNSETIKSRFQKLAVDYSQVALSRTADEYTPQYRLAFGLGGAGVPNIGPDEATSTMLEAQFRSTEKFDNRRSEFGMQLSVYMSTDTLFNNYPVEPGSGTGATPTETETSTTTSTEIQPKAFTNAMGLYGIYARNFIGAVESYNEIRHGINLGLGGLLTAGYFAASGRLGWDIFFGRRFSLNFAMQYVAASTVLVESQTLPTKGGIGYDAIFSVNF